MGECDHIGGQTISIKTQCESGSKTPAAVQDTVKQSSSLHVPARILNDGPPLSGIECISEYKEGGYHPVHLGDDFEAGRYRVLHKLGYGGLSTVWLARDTETNSLIALKIMVAAASDLKQQNEAKIWNHLKQKDIESKPVHKHLCMPSRSFRINGPNGNHACLIYPVTGFNLGDLHSLRLRGSVVRFIARQLIDAVACLHAEDICHGDLTPSNITLKLAGIDQWTDEEVEKQLGPVKIENVYPPNSQDPRRPQYMVQPADLTRVDPDLHTKDVVLIDLGEAFLIDDPPGYIGTPGPYRSPELWFGGRPGIGNDLWSLGLTIFTLRSGFELISNPFVGLGPSGSIRHIIRYLGPLPDHWDKLFFDMYGTARSRDEINPDLQQVYLQEDQEELLQPWDRTPEHPLATLGSFICDDYHGPIRPEDVEDKEIAAKYGQEWDPSSAMVKIPAEEAEPFSDMLQRLMCYEAKDQMSADSLRDHPWLTGQFSDNTPASDAPPLFQSNHRALW